jgi:hypothetical protein
LIVLGPVFVVLALRLPLINQLNYADAWFYSSYAWVPKHDFEIFGWNYFAARFTSILPIGLFSRTLGANYGYVLLRYLLSLACGTSVYVCVRRFAAPWVAIAAAVLLYLQPFFSRSLLWDYTFIEVAGGVVGVALWYWSDGRRLVWTTLPGIALASATFANANVATVIFVLLVVEIVAALRLGKPATLRCLARFGVLFVALIGVFSVGYFSYVAIIGIFDPYDLLRPTVEFLGENGRNSGPYVRPVHLWLLHEPRLWMPVITSVALLATMRRRVFDVTLPARVAQLCIACTAFLWLYRFTVTSSVLEVWWSYSIVVIATAPSMGVLLHELSSSAQAPLRWSCIGAGGFAVASIFIRDVPSLTSHAYRAISLHPSLLLGVLAVGILTALGMAWDHRWRRAAFAALFMLILAVMSYAPSVLDGRGTTGIFAANGTQEWKTYAAAERFIKIVQDFDAPSHRVFLWWPGTLGPVSITWSDLPQSGDTLNTLGVDGSIDQLTPLGVARLNQQAVKYVMILAPSLVDVRSANHALAATGFPGVSVNRGGLANGSLSFALIELDHR